MSAAGFCCYTYAMTERHSRTCVARQIKEALDTCRREHTLPVPGCWVCDERKAGR